MLGETFMFDAAMQESFLLGARDWLDGALSTFDGRAPEDGAAGTPADAMYRSNLITFLGLRTALLASPRLGAP